MTGYQYSVQLYTLREAVTTDLAGTLRRVAAMGFENVELWELEQYRDQYSSALAETGLRPLSAHAMLLSKDAEAALSTASALGVGTLIDPWIHPDRWTTREDIEAAAAELNAVAERACDQGITVGYHNHDHEIRADFGGRTGLEVFAEALDDQVVLEVDMFWAEVGGVSAAELVSRLGDRVAFLHTKDGAYSRDVSLQQPLGKGAMPVADVLKAAPDAVRVVEFDRYDGDIFAGVEDSLRYLVEVDR